MNFSEKLKDLISRFFAYCLLLAGSSLVAIAVWTHAHSAEPIMKNTAGIERLNNDLASDSHIKREIRQVSKRYADMEKRLDRKRDQRTMILISPSREDPAVLREKLRLDNEIKDLENKMESEQRSLHEAEARETQLIARLATA